ncbi:MAG TPA: hypothetical protein VKA19_01245, partial [Alphaproteobacteria bacterium]|nr:hypothetical protein [Alphaproteobacteria bacterium]
STGNITAGWGTSYPYTSIGLGYENIANQFRGSESITGIGEYQRYLAVFTKETVQIWLIDPDPAQDAVQQPLRNTGTRSPNAVIPYGSSDLFYLDTTGIRSLRARDASNAAFISDVGTAIDTLVTSHLASISEARIAAAQAVIEPIDARVMVAVGGVIYVFSYFPTSKISAWTTYDPVEISGDIEKFGVSRKIVFARAGDVVYAYGGLLGSTYPDDGEVTATVRLPFLDFNKPATQKEMFAFDATAQGLWNIKVLYDPNDDSKVSATSTFNGTTTADPASYTLEANSSHLAPLLTSSSGGYKSLSSVILHFQGGEAS